MGDAPRRTVLVVDNEPFNVDLVRTILTRGGFDVATAASGAEAIDIVAAEPPDVVLMDLQLPGMDGIEATSRIVASSPGVKVVAYSAMVLPADRERALAAGCVGFIPKPVGARELISLVAGYVAGATA